MNLASVYAWITRRSFGRFANLRLCLSKRFAGALSSVKREIVGFSDVFSAAGFHALETIRNALSEHGRVRMVVIAGEVGGRWSEETKVFLWSLACEKSRSEAIVLRGSVRAAWYRKWCKGSCFVAPGASWNPWSWG